MRGALGSGHANDRRVLPRMPEKLAAFPAPLGRRGTTAKGARALRGSRSARDAPAGSWRCTMSASVVAVPPIWPMRSGMGEALGCVPFWGRKGPHSLRLVQACEVPMEAPAKLKAGVGVRPKAPEPQLAFYRKYTEAMLRRYLTMSMEAGRVPSRAGAGDVPGQGDELQGP